MWRLCERFGNDLEPFADFAREDHAMALYRDIMHETDRHFVCLHRDEGLIDSPLLWRVWVVDPRTGTPGTQLLASATRSFAEACITDRRAAAEEWRLFYLESNGDQVTADHPDAPPPPPAPFYHAVHIEHMPGHSLVATTTHHHVVATFETQAEAEAFIRTRPGPKLHLLSTIGVAADALMKPVALLPEKEAEPAKPRRRAIRL